VRCGLGGPAWLGWAATGSTSTCCTRRVLHEEGVTATLAGSTNPQHVRAKAAAAEIDLPGGTIAQLEALIPLGPTIRT
jgi:aryl-alcohol dehydrogenase-like predicted oxidoreductase